MLFWPFNFLLLLLVPASNNFVLTVGFKHLLYLFHSYKYIVSVVVVVVVVVVVAGY